MNKAQIVADSIDPRKNRLTTMLITFPRFILAELNTHRMLSKNSASSRAIPFKKMVESVQDNPFIPIAWQKEHTGMQGTEYLTKEESETANRIWLYQRDQAINSATALTTGKFKVGEVVHNYNIQATKQLANRLLEPFMMHTVLISGTEWENFFALRCPDYQFEPPYSRGQVEHYRSRKDYIKAMLDMGSTDEYKSSVTEQYNNYTELDWLKKNKGQAEIHMMALAEAMWDAMNESTPKELKAGEWHIPFEDQIDKIVFTDTFNYGENKVTWVPISGIDNGAINWRNIQKVKVSTAMAARTSYTIVGDEKEFTLEQQIALHDRIISAKPLHASPLEHCARVMTAEEYITNIRGKGYFNQENELIFDKKCEGWCRNYRGFIQYREILENK